ncbi:hypothetical protein [Bartonella florencae]|uniref:hypothetical protein n=1 Tax=Bartonella florencae TaxID=928210 RepID=UPI00030C4104|nr:hypothetical protein [Bartonella florencae]
MALFPFSIADVDDPEHIRVALYASGRMGHAPLNALLKGIYKDLTQISQRLEALEKQLNTTDPASLTHKQDMQEDDKSSKVSGEGSKADGEISVGSHTLYAYTNDINLSDFRSPPMSDVRYGMSKIFKKHNFVSAPIRDVGFNAGGNIALSGSISAPPISGLEFKAGSDIKLHVAGEKVSGEGSKADGEI